MQDTAVTSIAAGAEHSVIATADGRVFAWGWGRYGNLGDNDRQDRHNPTQVRMVGVCVQCVGCVGRGSLHPDNTSNDVKLPRSWLTTPSACCELSLAPRL
jgi:alpha-tubulin suppressor-like RCC1 family protein